MDETRFPLFRRGTNGLNWYRIGSANSLTEIQAVGARYVLHRLEATTYPELLRIRELIAMEPGAVVAIEEAEFLEVLHKCPPDRN